MYMTEIDGELFSVLESWFEGMSKDEFSRALHTQPDDLLLGAYMRLAERGVDAERICPDDIKRAIAWFKQAGYCYRMAYE